MGKNKAIIFDIDGVLVDVSKSYREAIRQTAEFFIGGAIGPNEINELKAKTGYNNDWDLTEALILKRGIKVPKQKIVDKFQEFYLGTKKTKGLIENEKWLLDLEILEKLSKNYLLGILTGRPREEALIPLEKSGALKYFPVVIAMEDTEGKGKPNPFGLNLVLEKLGAIDRSNSMYVGDVPDDMRTAKNAGIIGIGCLPPQNKTNELRKALIETRGKVVLNEVNEIIKVVEGNEVIKVAKGSMKNFPSVNEILENVKQKGDEAVAEYNLLFDKNPATQFELTKTQIKDAYAQVDLQTIRALKFAAKNIKKFAQVQLKQVKGFKTKTNFGVLEQKVIPLQRVGCYVPGGNYPLPSTALMTIIPAKVAGVREVIVCSPRITPVVVVAADLAGADKIFNVGGVQAIGAMSYGTKQVPRVDKIVGPGNKYVAEAKKIVFGEVGIDFIAGPSEVLIVADESANPELIAVDLLAQAEHDVNAKANLITTSGKIAEQVKKELEKQLAELDTRKIAQQAIKNSKIIVVKNISEAIELANSMAPEHLGLQLKNNSKILDKFYNYGSLFVGDSSAEALGDYCLGPNHTLPTSGAARYTGGLSVRDFVKIVTVQNVTKTNKELIQSAARLAEVEGLSAHKKAALKRLA
jgi:histidinol dehydrogenase